MKRHKTQTQEATKPPGALLTIFDLAAALQNHPESIRRRIRAGTIEAVKVGRGWRVRADVLDRIKQKGVSLEAR